jgi:hypothetical protein
MRVGRRRHVVDEKGERMSQRPRSTGENAARSATKPYATPRLTAYGSLARLTAAGPGGSPEMAMMVMESRRF